jgi:hypothetical protein
LLRRGHEKFLPGLALNCNSVDLYLPNSLDNKLESACPVISVIFISSEISGRGLLGYIYTKAVEC